MEWRAVQGALQKWDMCSSTTNEFSPLVLLHSSSCTLTILVCRKQHVWYRWSQFLLFFLITVCVCCSSFTSVYFFLFIYTHRQPYKGLKVEICHDLVCKFLFICPPHLEKSCRTNPQFLICSDFFFASNHRVAVFTSKMTHEELAWGRSPAQTACVNKASRKKKSDVG